MQVVTPAHMEASEIGNVKVRWYFVSLLHHPPLLLFVCRVVECTQYATVWMLIQLSRFVEG
jgi:hypothetical protein